MASSGYDANGAIPPQYLRSSSSSRLSTTSVSPSVASGAHSPSAILEAMGIAADEEGLFSSMLVIRPTPADMQPVSEVSSALDLGNLSTDATLVVSPDADLNLGSYQHGGGGKSDTQSLSKANERPTKSKSSSISFGDAAASARHALEQREANGLLRDWVSSRRSIHDSEEKRSDWDFLHTQRLIQHFKHSYTPSSKKQGSRGIKMGFDKTISGKKEEDLNSASLKSMLTAIRPPPERISAYPHVTSVTRDDVAALTLGLSTKKSVEEGALKILQSLQTGKQMETNDGGARDTNSSTRERSLLPTEPPPVAQLRLVLAFAKDLDVEPNIPVFARIFGPEARPPSTVTGSLLNSFSHETTLRSISKIHNLSGVESDSIVGTQGGTSQSSSNATHTSGSNNSASSSPHAPINVGSTSESANEGVPRVSQVVQTHNVIAKKVAVTNSDSDPLSGLTGHNHYTMRYILPNENLPYTSPQFSEPEFSSIGSPVKPSEKFDLQDIQSGVIWPWIPAELAALPPKTFFHSDDFLHYEGLSESEDEIEYEEEFSASPSIGALWKNQGKSPYSSTSNSPTSDDMNHRRKSNQIIAVEDEDDKVEMVSPLNDTEKVPVNKKFANGADSESDTSSFDSDYFTEDEYQESQNPVASSYKIDLPWEWEQAKLRSLSTSAEDDVIQKSELDSESQVKSRRQRTIIDSESGTHLNTDSNLTSTDTESNLEEAAETTEQEVREIIGSTIVSDLVPWPERVTNASKSVGKKVDMEVVKDNPPSDSDMDNLDHEQLKESNIANDVNILDNDWNDEEAAAFLDVGSDLNSDNSLSSAKEAKLQDKSDFLQIFKRILESPEEEVKEAIKDVAPFIDPALISAIRSTPVRELSKRFRLNIPSDLPQLITTSKMERRSSSHLFMESDEAVSLSGLFEDLRKQLLNAHASFHTQAEETRSISHESFVYGTESTSEHYLKAFSKYSQANAHFQKERGRQLKKVIKDILVKLNAFWVADRGILGSSKKSSQGLFDLNEEPFIPQTPPPIEARLRAASHAQPILNVSAMQTGSTFFPSTGTPLPIAEPEAETMAGFMSDVMGRFNLRGRERQAQPKYEFIIDIYDVTNDVTVALYAQSDFMRAERQIGRVILPIPNMLGLSSPLPPSFEWYELLPGNSEEEPSFFSSIAASVGPTTSSSGVSHPSVASSTHEIDPKLNGLTSNPSTAKSQTKSDNQSKPSHISSDKKASSDLNVEQKNPMASNKPLNENLAYTDKNRISFDISSPDSQTDQHSHDGVSAFQNLKYLAADSRIKGSGLPRPSRPLGFICIGTQLKLFAPVFELYSAPTSYTSADLTKVRHFSMAFFKRSTARLQHRLNRPPLLIPLLYVWGWTNPKVSILFDAILFYLIAFAPVFALGPLAALLFFWLTVVSSQMKSIYEVTYAYEHNLVRSNNKSSSIANKLHKAHRTLCRYQSYFERAASSLERIDNLFSWIEPRITIMMHILLFGLSIIWAIVFALFEFRTVVSVVVGGFLLFPVVARAIAGSLESPLSSKFSYFSIFTSPERKSIRTIRSIKEVEVEEVDSLGSYKNDADVFKYDLHNAEHRDLPFATIGYGGAPTNIESGFANTETHAPLPNAPVLSLRSLLQLCFTCVRSDSQSRKQTKQNGISSFKRRSSRIATSILKVGSQFMYSPPFVWIRRVSWAFMLLSLHLLASFCSTFFFIGYLVVSWFCIFMGLKNNVQAQAGPKKEIQHEKTHVYRWPFGEKARPRPSRFYQYLLQAITGNSLPTKSKKTIKLKVRHAVAPIIRPAQELLQGIAFHCLCKFTLISKSLWLVLKTCSRFALNAFKRIPDGPESAHRTVARRQRVPTLEDIALNNWNATSKIEDRGSTLKSNNSWLGFFTRPAPVVYQSLLNTEKR